MNKIQIKRLSKRVDQMFKDKNILFFPLMGELSNGEVCRNVTLEEQEILKKKGLPVPITIEVKREAEFKEYLDYER